MTFDPTAAQALTTTSGGAIAKFPNIGDTVKLKITGLEQRQQTDFQTGEPITWPDGKPKMQFVFTGIDQDSQEEIRLFAKGFMLSAIKDALTAAGTNLEAGGILAVKYSADEPASRPGLNPAKKYVAQYQPPKPASISAEDLI
jgi:hypothetical protein